MTELPSRLFVTGSFMVAGAGRWRSGCPSTCPWRSAKPDRTDARRPGSKKPSHEGWAFSAQLVPAAGFELATW